MEPVIDSAAHDNHRPPVGLQGIVGEFASRMNHHIGINARELFLPLRSIRRVVFVGACALAAQPRINAVIGKRQVINCRHELDARLSLNLLDGNGTANHRFIAAVVAEIREGNFNNVIALLED